MLSCNHPEDHQEEAKAEEEAEAEAQIGRERTCGEEKSGGFRCRNAQLSGTGSRAQMSVNEFVATSGT